MLVVLAQARDIHNMFIVFVAFVLSGIAAAVYASGN